MQESIADPRSREVRHENHQLTSVPLASPTWNSVSAVNFATRGRYPCDRHLHAEADRLPRRCASRQIPRRPSRCRGAYAGRPRSGIPALYYSRRAGEPRRAAANTIKSARAPSSGGGESMAADAGGNPATHVVSSGIRNAVSPVRVKQIAELLFLVGLARQGTIK